MAIIFGFTVVLAHWLVFNPGIRGRISPDGIFLWPKEVCPIVWGGGVHLQWLVIAETD